MKTERLTAGLWEIAQHNGRCGRLQKPADIAAEALRTGPEPKTGVIYDFLRKTHHQFSVHTHLGIAVHDAAAGEELLVKIEIE